MPHVSLEAFLYTKRHCTEQKKMQFSQSIFNSNTVQTPLECTEAAKD